MGLKRNVAQINMKGSWEELENALDDISDRLDDAEKAKESIPPARDTLAQVMLKHGKDSIKHRGRSFSVKEIQATLKLSVRKEKEG